MLRAAVEGVNFQAVKDLKSLASAAALKGPASASKWLSAQTRLPRRRRPLHPLFHHLLDVKSSPEPISVIICTLTHPSHPRGGLRLPPSPARGPLGDYAERARLKAEEPEKLESRNLGFSHQSPPHPFRRPGECVLGPKDPCKSLSEVWWRPYSIPLTHLCVQGNTEPSSHLSAPFLNLAREGLVV